MSCIDKIRPNIFEKTSSKKKLNQKTRYIIDFSTNSMNNSHLPPINLYVLCHEEPFDDHAIDLKTRSAGTKN